MNHCSIDNLLCESRKYNQTVLCFFSSCYTIWSLTRYIPNNFELLPSARWTASCHQAWLLFYSVLCIESTIGNTVTSYMHICLLVLIWKYTMHRIKPCNLPFKLGTWYMPRHTGTPSCILSMFGESIIL